MARYLNEMLIELSKLDPSIKYLLYASAPFVADLPSANCEIRAGIGPLARKPNTWTQLVLPRLMRDDGVDVFWGQIIGLPLRLKCNCRRVLTMHDLVPMVAPSTMARGNRLKTRIMLRLAARAADCVVAVSQATARLALRHLGVSSDKVRVIYEGTSRTLVPLSRADAEAAVWRHFGLTGGYLLFVSTIEPRKDHLTLLRALDEVPDAPLLVLAGGTGWRCGGILGAIRAGERAGKVRYLGRVADEQLAALYGAARLSVYPSWYEGFGLPVLEAMACGCPVLCSWSSSLPEVGGCAARYFRPRDAHDLAAKLARLLSSPSELEEMSKAGRERASKFSFSAAAQEMMSVLVPSTMC